MQTFVYCMYILMHTVSSASRKSCNCFSESVSSSSVMSSNDCDERLPTMGSENEMPLYKQRKKEYFLSKEKKYVLYFLLIHV